MKKPRKTAKASSKEVHPKVTPLTRTRIAGNAGNATKPKAKVAKVTRIPRSDGKAGKPNDVSWHDRFLLSLRDGAPVETACTVAGVSRNAAYEHRERFPVFGQQWELARKAGRKMRADAVEDGFLDRIQNGTLAFTGGGEPIIDPKTKKQCREFQDQVVLKTLERIMPEVYSPKQKLELSGALRMTDEEIVDASKDAEQSLLLTLAAGLNGANRHGQ